MPLADEQIQCGATVGTWWVQLLNSCASSNRLASLQPGIYQGGQQTPGHRAGNRNPTVAPVAVACAGDGQEGMRHAGAEVAGGINGVASGASEGESNGKHQQGDRHG